MKVNGIGVVKKSDILSVFTKDGCESIYKGDISWEEAGEIYKLEMAKRISRIGKFGETFFQNYNRIPNEILNKLSDKEIASLVDAFYQCYGDGKADNK